MHPHNRGCIRPHQRPGAPYRKEGSMGKAKDEVCKDIFEEYSLYGLVKITSQIENGTLPSELEKQIREAMYAQKNELRRNREKEENELEKEHISNLFDIERIL